MADDNVTGGDRDHEPVRDDEGLTRRRFVTTSGVAVGAVIVWASPFPFADAAIGQVIRSNAGNDPTGPTGPTGTTGSTASTGSTAPTASTGSTATTGTTGTSGSSELSYGKVSAGLGRIKDVRIKAGSLTFTQEILEPGTAHWWVFLHVPHDQSPITMRIGAAHDHILAAGEHRIKVSFSEFGKKEAKRHAHAAMSIDTSFVDSYGRRFAKAYKVQR
jgi:hypothetical protein